MSLSSVVHGSEILLSIDPAQTADYAGITLVRLEGISKGGAAEGRILGCSRQQRVTYDRQAAQIVGAVNRLYDAGARGVVVVLDAGGVGRGLLDIVRAADPLTAGAVGLSMHGGSKSFVDREYNIIRAAKLSVVSFLDGAFSGGRLTYSPDMPGLDLLTAEIQGLRANQTQAGNIMIEAGSGMNDDVVFSLAQGWYAVASQQIGEPIWSERTVNYFERLSEAAAPAEDGQGARSDVRAFEEAAEPLIPVRSQPYRFRMG